MQSTIALFEHLYKHCPPLFPPEIKDKMEHALSHLKNDQTVTLEAVERTMITFGYELWPWNQAYREFLALAESHMGEHFLLPRLSKGLQEKYHDFKKYGGTFRDLHAGQPAHYFNQEERSELCLRLVEMQHDLRSYVEREVVGLQRKKYLERVKEFGTLLEEIRGTLNHLKELAESEQDHPTLAGEIRSKVEHFEHGLCLLGPELEYDAVCQSPEFFKGRRLELNRLRGIHIPHVIPS